MLLGEEEIGTGPIGLDESDLGIGVPTDLNSYQNLDGNVVLYWTFDPFVYSFYALSWELQTDIVDTFDSPSLLAYTSGTMPAADYIAGCIHRGMVVPIYARAQDTSKRMYWRIRGVYDAVNSDWASGYYDIPPAVNVATRTSLLSFLPEAVYSKEPGTTPGVGSNVYKIHDDYANEFENANRQMTFVNKDLYVKDARDAALQPNFGDLLGMVKPTDMKVIDYREILKVFMTSIRSAPSRSAVRNLVYEVYRNEPVFRNIRDVYGAYVHDSGLPDFYVQDAGLDDAYVWNDENLAAGVIIEVYNQLACGATVTKEYVEGIIANMIQVHTPVYIKPI